MRKNNKKGFTLAELLIVVAIIGVLVAISIPIFTSQLEKAREATDIANIRSAYAEAATEAITTKETTVTVATKAKMQSDGKIDHVASEMVGPWETSSITITTGQITTVTGTTADHGNTWTWTLSGGASAEATQQAGGGAEGGENP